MMEQNFFTVIVAHMAIVWIVLAIIFATIEGFTFGLVTIWFTVGALVAAIVALIGGNLPAQLIAFFAISIILLVFTRPILVKHLKVGKEKNNIEIIEGKRGLVTEMIAPFKSGLVKVNGIVWTAVGETPDAAAEVGQEVEVIRVEGVKLIVSPVPAKPTT
ncbi:MAG: NfeD family protein [Clostridiales Family XIII bacterium]|jgi:membrane protein implicated in regulation of membrane protease activity|nr:NfeD family protein [Clostridiales Family XIII bacterium]